MLNHRFRIFSSLLIAFIIVNIYVNFTGIKDALANFKFPTYNFGKLFSLNFQPNNQFNNPDGSVNYKYISPVPTSTPATITGLINQTPTPSIINHPSSIISPTPSPIQPTRPVQPTATKYVKPTKIPPPPPITTDYRPGSTMAEVFADVAKRACIPAAFLHAIQTIESGDFFNYNSPASTVKIYNTYGWWINGTGNPCTGLGYDTATGFVPADSVNAGYHCWTGAGGDPQGIMGILQVSQFEQDATRKYTTAFVPGNFDRRVIFDNALIFAIATKNRMGVTPKSCTDWTDDEVQVAAEKHYGSCADSYCSRVLQYYKQYR